MESKKRKKKKKRMHVTKQKHTHRYREQVRVTSWEEFMGKVRGVGLRYRLPCIKEISNKGILGST